MSTGDRRRAAAALAVAWTLGLAAWPSRPESDRSQDPGCPVPAETASAEGATTRVECEGRGGPLRGAARLLFGLRLDVNRADPRALAALPGIGPARARAIEQTRARRAFTSLAELRRVPGIGPGLTRSLAGWLEVREPEAALDRLQPGP